MNTYQKQWTYLQTAWQQERYPQALLFVGPLNRSFLDFLKQLTAFVFCKNKENQPCQKCNDCQMAIKGEHPDLQWIKPDKSMGPIKIDQIRDLQHYSYLTPQRAKHRLIIIESADRMNTAAANALLKILEEPAPHTLFLLLAQQLSTVLPTVLSRCQTLRFSTPNDLLNNDLLVLGAQYSQESDQALIINQTEFILEGLITVIEHKEHPSVIAAQWTQFELNSFLWFLYLIYAQVQVIIMNQSTITGLAAKQLHKLALLLNSVRVFTQLDKINKIQRKLSHNMNVNHVLVLEDLLLNLQDIDEHECS